MGAVKVGSVTTGPETDETEGKDTGGTAMVVVVTPLSTVEVPTETVTVVLGSGVASAAEEEEEAPGVTVRVVSGTVAVTVTEGVGSGKTGRVIVVVTPLVRTMEVMSWAAARVAAAAAARMEAERILAVFCFGGLVGVWVW